MRKIDEISNPHSCMSRALPGEMTFVLLARDAAAPAAVREWADVRVRTGKNEPDDEQIVDALNTADVMEQQRDEIRRLL